MAAPGPEPVLVRIELSFRATDDQDLEALGDRIREAAAMVVGRDSVEEFRLRSLPLTERQRPQAPGDDTYL